MEERKYKLTDETKEVYGTTLHRIAALKDFAGVKNGSKGGWIEKESNLAQNGNAWVYGDAAVYGDAEVYGNARVCGNAEVYGDAEVYGNAWVYGNGKVYGDAEVYGNAWVYGDAEVYGNAWVYGDAEVYGNAWVCGDAEVCGEAKVYGDAEVYGNAWVYGEAKVYGNARVCGDAEVCGEAKVYGEARVCGDAEVCGEAKVCNNADYIVFKNFWSSGRYFTWTRSNNKWKVGCFYGSGEELIAKAYKDSEKSGREYERVVRYVERASSLTRRKINRTSDMIDILWMIVNVAFAALVWFRIGRQQAFDKLLHDYKELAKICQIQELIIKSYKQKYGELTDEETKGKN